MRDTSLHPRQPDEPAWSWWVILLAGLVSIAAGIVVVAKPSDSLATLAVVVGIFVLIDGIAELLGALIGHTENRGMLAVLGVLSVIAGVLLIRHPLGGVNAVALVLGIWLIAAGLVRFLLAFDSGGYRLGRMAVALVLVVLGIVIIANPHIGYATLAVITGIGFICYGLGMVAVAWAIHMVREENVSVAPDASAMT